MQESDILKQVTKSVKEIKDPKFDNNKYSAIWQIFLTPIYNEIFLNE
jgi:hypothetical protein